MEMIETARLTELTEFELDAVAAGTLVNLNNLVAINIGVELANQANIAVLSMATQGGKQILNLGQLAIS